MNKWGIPIEIEQQVLKRDVRCVYCLCEFDKSIRKLKPSWEHIINDIRITTIDNIALCCVSCNASKGSKKLIEWFSSNYCCKKKISIETVAPIIRQHLLKYIN